MMVSCTAAFFAHGGWVAIMSAGGSRSRAREAPWFGASGGSCGLRGGVCASVDCTVDRCDDDNRQCVFVADDSLCAEGEVCDLKAGCFAPRECVRDEDCDDGLLCDGQESCEGESCQPGEPVVCEDGVACTRNP